MLDFNCVKEKKNRHLFVFSHFVWANHIGLDIDKAKKRAKMMELYGDGEPVVESKNHKCDQCGKLFARRLTLRQHLTTHSDERPFECLMCKKT